MAFAKGKYAKGINWLAIIFWGLIAAIVITLVLILFPLGGGNPPEDTQPGTSAPATESTQPDTTAPEEMQPSDQESTVPETEPTTLPETTEPETTVPETTEPETTLPETQPDAGANPAILQHAREQLGKPFMMGKDGPDSYDVSGLVYDCGRQAGVDAPRTVNEQVIFGTAVAREDILPGDVVFFWSDNPEKVDYCGIYSGNGKFIYSSSSKNEVIERNLTDSYYEEHLFSVRRYAK